MEARKITVVQTKTQKKSVIMSSATTLGELKEDFRTNGIDYNEMTFYEGLSKTELKSDESILPHDIERNGVITNELVFMLTNTDKKIRSGMSTRSEAYDAIKKAGLQGECKKMFGKNFTMCKTEDLLLLLSKTQDAPAPENPKCCKDTVSCKAVTVDGCKDNVVRDAVRYLTEVLYSSDIIDSCEYDQVLSRLDRQEPAEEDKSNGMKSSYTDDEINQMFRGM